MKKLITIIDITTDIMCSEYLITRIKADYNYRCYYRYYESVYPLHKSRLLSYIDEKNRNGDR